MSRILLYLSFALCLATVSFAGPNAGGTLVLHDAAQINFASSYCLTGMCPCGTIPESCSAVDAEAEYPTEDGYAALIKVYAAFPEGSSPRLLGVTWGVNYDLNQIILAQYGKCGDFELNDESWPGPGMGSTVTWNNIQTGLLVPVYWFLGQTYSRPATLHLTANPTQGGCFGDDSIPSVLDGITGYGAFGFGTPGLVYCPGVTPGGVCCTSDGACEVSTPDQCQPPRVWYYEWTSCSPNPCPSPAACCDVYGLCTLTQPFECQFPSTWHADWPSCAPNPCPQRGACCDPASGSCNFLIESECWPSHIWHSEWTSCEPNPCPQPIYVCCAPDGSCTLTTAADCPLPNYWHWFWPSCDPNPCPEPPTGACCDEQTGECALTIQADCGAPRVWHPEWPSCAPNPCPPPTPTERVSWGRIKQQYR